MMSVTELEKPTRRPTPTRATQVVDRPRVQPRRAPQTTPRTTPRTTPKPHVQVRVRVVQQPRTNVAGAWALRAAAFGGIFLSTYVASALTGQVFVEKARRQEIAAKERAIAARRAEAEIRERVDALTSAAAVQQWASARGYIAPDAQVPDPKHPRA